MRSSEAPLYLSTYFFGFNNLFIKIGFFSMPKISLFPIATKVNSRARKGRRVASSAKMDSFQMKREPWFANRVPQEASIRRAEPQAANRVQKGSTRRRRAKPCARAALPAVSRILLALHPVRLAKPGEILEDILFSFFRINFSLCLITRLSLI